MDAGTGQGYGQHFRANTAPRTGAFEVNPARPNEVAFEVAPRTGAFEVNPTRPNELAFERSIKPWPQTIKPVIEVGPARPKEVAFEVAPRTGAFEVGPSRVTIMPKSRSGQDRKGRIYRDAATGYCYTNAFDIASTGRRRIVLDGTVTIGPLVDVPKELAPDVRHVCEPSNGPTMLIRKIVDILAGPDTPDEDKEIARKMQAHGETEMKSEVGFTCLHNLDEFAEEKACMLAEGYLPFVADAANGEGQLGELTKVGNVYKLCHVAAAVGTFEEKHLCHRPVASYVYQTTLKEEPEHKFHLACHDSVPGQMHCHPLRKGDTAFLHQFE